MISAIPALLLGAATAPSDEALPHTPSPPAARCIRLLRDSREPSSPGAEELVERLAPDAGPACTELVDLLVERRVPALEEGEEAQTLSVPQRELILAALERLDPAQLLPQADRLTGGDPTDPAPRAVALRLIALGGGAEDLQRLVSIAHPPELPPAERVEEAFEWSVTVLVRREGAGTTRALLGLAGEDVEPLLVPVLRAVSAAGDPRGLEVVLDIAERHSALRLEAFALARRLGSSGDAAIDARFAALLRGHLVPTEPRIARAAAMMLGELGDPDAVEALVRLLEANEVAAQAHWALERITGLRMRPDRGRWMRWFEDERRFFALDYPQLVEDLHGEDPARAVAAVRELSRHRLRRDEVAEELALALGAPGAQREMICVALQALGSRRAVPALVERLADENRRVVEAAHQALRVLTGLELGADVAAWQAATAG